MSRHSLPVKTLDLAHAGQYIATTRTVVDKMNIAAHVPGFKPSAAFFTALRSNLLLPPENSTTITMSTPLIYTEETVPDDLMLTTSSPHISTSPPHQSPPLDSIPPLKTEITTSVSAQTEALKLIADSIAQQRQIASYAIITHPLILSIYILLITILTKYLYKTPSDLGILITTTAGISMACLIAIRAACSPYISAAEKINLSFLDPPSTSPTCSEILITSTYGTNIIGALVLHLESNRIRTPPSPNKKYRKSQGKKGTGKAIIRAWTTAIRYRGKGIGSSLLEEAVRVTRERVGREAEIGFSVDHANSLRVWPGWFDGGVVGGEQRAGRKLEEVVGRVGGRRRRW